MERDNNLLGKKKNQQNRKNTVFEKNCIFV